MVFLGILGFIILVIVIIGSLLPLFLQLYNGKKSIYTPIGLIVFSATILIVSLIIAEGSMAVVGLISLIVGVVWYLKYKLDEKDGVFEMERERERQQIESERLQAIESQNQSEPWSIRYMTSPCPYCGHYKVRYAKWEDKQLSVAFWGIASGKIGTNYKCEHCGKMWE